MDQPPVVPASDAYEQVKLPAIALMIVGVLCALASIASLLMNVLGVGAGAFGSHSNGGEQVGQLMGGVIGIVMAGIGILIGGFIVFGGMKMKDLDNWNLSLGAAIASALPCGFPCCCLGIPVGIWALVVLLRPEVKAAFR
jgi:hypothetical protein